MVHRFLRKIFSAIFIVGALVLNTGAVFAYEGSSVYDCGYGGDFPMRFAGCVPGYYYEDWENADDSLTPEDVGECLSCPANYTCAGGFSGPQRVGCNVGYYGDGTTCTACTNSKPANSHYSDSAQTNSCPWACDDGYIKSGNSCVACGANEFSANNTCQTTKFSITTTSDAKTFQFKIAADFDFDVNCGDGGTLSGPGVNGNNIRGDYAYESGSGTYKCRWESAGAHTIKFSGTATGYIDNEYATAITFNVDGSQEKIASVSGNLSSMFPYMSGNPANGAQPRFYETFYGATNLTSIPDTLFADYTTGASYMFYGTFSGCTGLTSLPAGLFSGITIGAHSMFSSTFGGCTGLTSLPAGLFSGITTGANNMFTNTFNRCTGLTSLPAGLFSSITTGAGYMFSYTFNRCTGLTSLPAGLFSGITTGENGMFSSTFYGCTGLTSLPAGLFGSISSTTGASAMFQSTFQGCTGLTSIPAGLFSSITTGAEYMFSQTFYGCTGLTSLPSGLFSSITTGANDMFTNTFNGCTGLTSIPAGLFSGITTGAQYMFYGTFKRCTGLQSIPANLFSNITTGANYMFYSTFYGCTGLTSLPSGLFSNITTGAQYMFLQTFSDCTGLTSLPAGLFSSITTGAQYMFSSTFSGCTNLSGYIPPTTFAGLIANGHPTASNMWYYTFYNTALATSCPANTQQYITGYEGSNPSTTWNGKVSCGCGIGYYGDGQTCNACTNSKPSNSHYIDAPSTNSCSWACDSGYVNNNSSCNACGANEFYADNGTCQTNKFSVTTTSDATSLSFLMSAIGTFYVDCGDGGTLSGSGVFNNTMIVRGDTYAYTFTCTWQSSGVHTVRFSGAATAYSSGGGTMSFSTDTKTKIASISGNLSSMFPYIPGNSADGAQPRFGGTFSGAINLTSVPDTLFANYTHGSTYMFSSTFYGCTGLTSLPAGLFSNITTGAQYMFSYTFQNCTGLTSLPDGLFSGITTGAESMFYYTFYGCTGLTSLPAGLFSGITTGTNYMFQNTFYGCTGLTSLPAGLFSGITTGANYMFERTFSGCTGLTSLPAGLFSGITTGAEGMFYNTFSGCTGLTSLPAGLFSGITTGANYMFAATFSYCTGLTSLPAGLFSGITTGANYMFSNTFYGCTGLTSIPAGLFSGITTGANYMFYMTFYACTNLSGYIPPSTFAGLIANGHPTASNMWNNTFTNTALATSCDGFSHTTQYITGYEGSNYSTTWNGKVSCECASGYYGTNSSCTACSNTIPANSVYSGNATTNSCPWTCSPGYTEYKNACHGFCSGNRKLRIGTNPVTSYPAFSDKTNVPSPVLHIKDANDEICYIYFEPDVGGEHGVKVLWTDGKKYHAVDPTQ